MKEKVLIKNKTCKGCNTSFTPNSGRQDYCSHGCKKTFLHPPAPDRVLSCQQCNKEFTATGSTSKFCSVTCRDEATTKNKPKKFCLHCSVDMTYTKRSRKFCSSECSHSYHNELHCIGDEGVDFITCPICQDKLRQITKGHAALHGFTSIKEMQESLNMPAITCSKIKQLVQGENNPGYQHGGKCSVWSKNFVNGYDAEKHQAQKDKLKESQLKTPEKHINNIEYWLKKFHGDVELAATAYKKHQSRDLDYFVTKYGEIEGAARHLAKTNKWINSFKKQNFSKISQTLFTEIIARSNLDLTQIYFATFARADMSEYKNKEFRLPLASSYILPDFIYLSKKKIIEFDGEYWHTIKANPSRDLHRDIRIRAAGYEVHHVPEHEYITNKEKVIQECLTFLNQ